MSSPNPVTPLPSQWDSTLVKLLATALGSLGALAAAVVAVFFPKLDAAMFERNWGIITGALVVFIIAVVAIVQAWRVRRNEPIPPIAGTDAVAKTAVREQRILSGDQGAADKTVLSPVLIGALALVLALSALGGCAGTRAAYKAAGSDPSDLVFVVTEHYGAVVKEAADLRERGNLPASLVRAMQEADRAGRPVIEALEPLRAAWLASKSPADAAALQAKVNEAITRLADLLRAVKAARPVASTARAPLVRYPLHTRFA